MPLSPKKLLDQLSLPQLHKHTFDPKCILGRLHNMNIMSPKGDELSLHFSDEAEQSRHAVMKNVRATSCSPLPLIADWKELVPTGG